MEGVPVLRHTAHQSRDAIMRVYPAHASAVGLAAVKQVSAMWRRVHLREHDKQAHTYCSKRCRAGEFRASGAGKAMKARKRTATVERFLHAEIFERDGWRCRLCGKAVNRKAKAPHPKSATIDHIVPLAQGGEHSRVNVQCAHFLCNSRKGDRTHGEGEQLLLVG